MLSYVPYVNLDNTPEAYICNVSAIWVLIVIFRKDNIRRKFLKGMHIFRTAYLDATNFSERRNKAPSYSQTAHVLIHEYSEYIWLLGREENVIELANQQTLK